MSIPALDMKSPYLELKDELDAAWQRVMLSGWYILGKEVEAFEPEFAAYCGARHCVGVGNGLEARHLIPPTFRGCMRACISPREPCPSLRTSPIPSSVCPWDRISPSNRRTMW